MKISTFIFFGFLIILVMFSITTYINFRLADQVHDNSEFLARSTEIIRSSNRYQRNIQNMVSGLRGYLLTGEEYFIQAYDSAKGENETILDELTAVIPAQSIQQKSISRLRELRDQWFVHYANPLIDAKKNSMGSDSSLAAFNGLLKHQREIGIETRLSNGMYRRIRDLMNEEYNIRATRKNALEASINRTRKISIYLIAFSTVTGLIIAAYLAYRISRRIIKMVAMADNIAQGNYEVYSEDSTKDELSLLSNSLNHMSRVLSENISLLKRKNSELDQFAHIVSHDLKAPLRGIDNVVSWIEEDHIHELSPKVREYIGLIKSRVVRGENLIHGILSYSRVGQYEIEREEVDLNQMMSDILENVTRRPGLAINVQPGLPIFYTERVPLMQIFSNLISNAVKYMDKPDGKINIYYKEEETNYIFYVADNGPGISKNYHEKIFIIFQTLNGTDSFENTGVGLAIVKKILDDRQQRINVISEPGKGSTFAFTWAKN